MACSDCASGHLHEGTPAGRVETLHGLPAYVTGPPGNEPSKGTVVIIPDAFGWNLNNSRILADAYAKRAGVTVYLPDFMNGTWNSSMVIDLETIAGQGKGGREVGQRLMSRYRIRTRPGA